MKSGNKRVGGKTGAIIALCVLLVVTIALGVIGVTGVSLPPRGLYKVLSWLPTTNSENWPESLPLGLDLRGGMYVEYSGKAPEGSTADFDSLREGTMSIIRSRLSDKGYNEANVQQLGADGIRVDGVSSMLYLNFGVTDRSKFKTNREGGDGDLDAISFLREFNYMIGTRCPGVFTVAEESSAWPMVTWPPDKGGLGFHYKWNMGWMNDTLEYMKTDFPFRSYHHNKLTFSLTYAYSENFILPLSHDEVVHGKYSLIGRMPGDIWRQFAGIRMLMLYQMRMVKSQPLIRSI